MSDNKTFQSLEKFTCHSFHPITGKYQEQSAILPVSVNMAAKNRNDRKNPRIGKS